MPNIFGTVSTFGIGAKEGYVVDFTSTHHGGDALQRRKNLGRFPRLQSLQLGSKLIAKEGRSLVGKSLPFVGQLQRKTAAVILIARPRNQPTLLKSLQNARNSLRTHMQAIGEMSRSR